MLKNKKKILFLTSTRAEYGKIKTLIEILKKSKKFTPYIFITGLHMLEKFGSTYTEVTSQNNNNFKKFYNKYTDQKILSGDLIISEAIIGLRKYVMKIKPDLIIIHGDKQEALAGAIVGCMNNIMTGHIEGGEISGNIDEIIRHSISKLSHVHFTSNKKASKRLLKMGEDKKTVYTIGSPDIDLLFQKPLISFEKIKKRYEINFKKKDYGIFIWHPDSLNKNVISLHTKKILNFLIKSKLNYIVIYPNNDYGNDVIIRLIKQKLKTQNFKIFPSIRFENFIQIMKNSKFIIGNSSAGIREAPYFGLNIINIGDRQNLRSDNKEINNINVNLLKNLNLKKILKKKVSKKKQFGYGNSFQKFYHILNKESFWLTEKQKQFKN